MPSLGKIEEFNPASTNINHCLERLKQYFIANSTYRQTIQTQSNPDICYRFQSLRCPFAPVLTRISFGENFRWPCNHSQGPFCSEETSNHRTIPISQLHSRRRRRRFHLRRQAQTPRFYLQLQHTSKRSTTWSSGLWTSQQGDPEKVVNPRTQFWWSSQKGTQHRGNR